MKNPIKIIIAAFAISLVSCMSATDAYNYNNPYSQGYSDGYRDGYYQSPDGLWYAPNVIYLDNNGSYYRNGTIYKSRSRTRNNVIISPRRNSLHNQGMIRPDAGRQQNGIRPQPSMRGQDNVRSIPQNKTQPQNDARSNENTRRKN